MANFKVIQSKSMNHATVGDVIEIENVHRTVTKMTKRHIFLDDNYTFGRKTFNRWIRMSLRIERDSVQHYKALSTPQSIVVAEDNSRLNSFEPTNTRRRFIICALCEKDIEGYISETGQLDIYFATKPTMHSDMNKAVHDADDNTWKHRTISGGFYHRLSDKLILEGVSGSYGMNRQVLEEAIAQYKDNHPNLKFIIDTSWYYEGDFNEDYNRNKLRESRLENHLCPDCGNRPCTCPKEIGTDI